jgi:hypothetical protein
MKFQPSAAAVGWLLTLVCMTAQAEPTGPAFPGNEAVRIVNGKRVVETPPLTAAAKRFVDGGGKTAPPALGSEVFMIEGAQGLMECRGVFLSSTGCLPSSLGTSKRSRFWTVKLDGVWMHCESRAPSRKCEPASAGVPGGMGTVE